jgi:hypothetical protein
MSYIGSQVKMLFGAGGDQLARASAGSNHQLIQELLTATTGRSVVGDQGAGNAWSAHVVVGAGTAPVGTLSVQYSNLPNPDPAVDAHWGPNDPDAFGTGAPTLDLSVAGSTFRIRTPIVANHVRFKVTRTSGTISVIVWVKILEST